MLGAARIHNRGSASAPEGMTMAHATRAGADPGGGVPEAAVSPADRFRQAVVARDYEALRALLAADVMVFGPVIAEPVRGVREAGAVLWAALARFEDIRYFGQLTGATEHGDDRGGVETHVLRFHATVNGRQVEGVDVLELTDDGLIGALTVLFRPLESVLATTFMPRRHRGDR
jgi:hypothetical protein